MTSQGRPKTPGREEAVAQLFERMHEGESVRSIARSLGLRRGTLVAWATETPQLASQYARAREAQADANADELLEIANGVDAQTAEAQHALDHLGQELVANRVPNPRSVLAKYESQIVQRDRLRVDALKWRTAKFHPNRFGDRVEHEHAGTNQTSPARVTLFDAAGEVPDGVFAALAAAGVRLFLPENGRDPASAARLSRIGIASDCTPNPTTYAHDCGDYVTATGGSSAAGSND